MSAPTIEQKAAAFDELCRALKGKAEFVKYKERLVQPEFEWTGGRYHIALEAKYERVPVYEWRLRADGESDIGMVLLKSIGWTP